MVVGCVWQFLECFWNESRESRARLSLLEVWGINRSTEKIVILKNSVLKLLSPKGWECIVLARRCQGHGAAAALVVAVVCLARPLSISSTFDSFD